MASNYVGARIRQLRLQRGVSQVTLAQQLGISASYLNQIEHDVRPLTTPVLLRVSELLGVDATFFSPQEDTRLIAELQEVALDPELGIDAEPRRLAEMVSAHPDLARALVTMHNRYRNTSAQLAAATDDRFSDGSGSATISKPHEEVRDYFYQRQNYIHELDTAAEKLAERVRGESGDLRQELPRLLREHGVEIIARIDMAEGVLHRYDPQTRVLEIAPQLSGGQRAFKLAAELSYFECGSLMRDLVAEGHFLSRDAEKLAMLGLANYFAAAAVLPYQAFHSVAERFRYDIERLSAYFAQSYETICHRLSTLQRPELRGVPFSFVRVDRAGNMSKRQSATGFHFSSSGGTCPLWNVYETFAYPGKIMTQIAQMPDGRKYLWIARTVERRATHYGQPGKTFAIGLGCEIRHASAVIYADGFDLEAVKPTPIGAGCRVCDRANCPQRAFPPLGKTLDISEHRSSVSPYVLE